MPLTAAEIIAHPAFDTVEWHLEPSRSGYCEVARARHGGPFRLYWEIHGKGDVKLVDSWYASERWLRDFAGGVRFVVGSLVNVNLDSSWGERKRM
ncbi:hypothetical protein FOPE_08382 [Fonsecaea pedrosoi]|nr:hypothetical protein FOPE_08382 [Fonsecaea pedrosoi]